jgi:hypothetical protein
MQIPTFIRPLAAALLCGLALSACGYDDSSGEPAAADRETANRDAMLAYAKCMRDNGVDMPDPAPGERGIRLRAPEGVTPEEMEAAEEECRPHLDKVEAPELSEEQQKEFQDAALAHARCMREHGIDIPDPTFGANGEARIRVRRGRGDGATGPDPDDPKWKAAEEACRDKLPFGGEGPSREQSP